MPTDSQTGAGRTVPSFWAYREAFGLAGGIFLAGIGLQLIIGRGVPEPVYPTNIMLLVAFVFGLVAIQVFAGNSRLIVWLRSVPVSISAIALVLIQAVLMGSFPQKDGSGLLGDVMHSWPFVLTILYFLANLGLVTLARAFAFKKDDLGFILNHAGLWIALACGMLGAGDLVRLTMHLGTGNPEWRAIDSHDGHGHVVEMPFALELDKFEMEIFPPKLALVDTLSHDIDLSRGSLPFEIAKKDPAKTNHDKDQIATLGTWQINVLEYLPDASPKDDIFEPTPDQVGSSPAVLVVATRPDASGTVSRQGWVSCGSFAMPPAFLQLDDKTMLAMLVPEPSRFASQVTVMTPEQEKYRATIEVNKPLSVKGFKLYQLSYDERRGRWSQTSIIEIVRDPWLPAVYAGIYMMIAGAVFIMLKARKARS